MAPLSATFPILVLFFIWAATTAAPDFNRDCRITWGDGRAKVVEGGRGLTLSLDQNSGSGFESRNEYMFGRFDMQLKLAPGNSAGTVTTFFVSVSYACTHFSNDWGFVLFDYQLSSQGSEHDEIDFEFLGNSSGEPYTVHTNVFALGKGNKEQQFHLWFDPAAAFHTYSIVWNPLKIIFLVDNIPIRVHNNHEASGVPFPKIQPMRVHCSLWNADDWATQGGLVKTDWTKAPFVAYYRNFNIDANSPSTNSFSNGAWQNQGLDASGRNRLRWVQLKHMVYNYCTDRQRFPQGSPAECKKSRF